MKKLTDELWKDRPWIFPSLLGVSVLALVVASLVGWLELYFNVAYTPFLNVPTLLWTTLAVFFFWMVSVTRSVVLSASHAYILRSDGLEVRSGIISSRSFVMAPTGFSDLEVTRSISQRILNTGDITVRTQGEKDIRLVRVKNPMIVAGRIREVMARPVVRLERQELTARSPVR